MATTTAWHRFQQAQMWQSMILPDMPADHMVVTESAENRHLDWPVVVEPRGEPPSGLYNLSAMRNQIRLYAQRGDYDGFMVLESDFVILRWPATWAETWAIPFAVYDNPGVLTLQDLDERQFALAREKRAWEILGNRALIPVSCVLVNRSVYHLAAWDECFEGCGYDDWDFYSHMSRQVGPCEATDLLLLHRWHQSTMSMPRDENKTLYESKWGLIQPTYV